jgi:DNA primase large subunit
MNFERFSAGKLFNPRTGTLPQPIKDVFAKMGGGDKTEHYMVLLVLYFLLCGLLVFVDY